jgi:lactoylglutathione lyase
MADNHAFCEASMIPIRALFECHLRVTDLEAAKSFYGNVLGLKIAHQTADPPAVFYWIGGRGQSMLGLWQAPKVPSKLHLAFRVDLPDLLNAVQRLRSANVTPRDFDGNPTDKPIVLAWMPAAAVYFKDPDENLLEFICMLGDAPRPDLGVICWADWLNRNNRAAGAAAKG